MLKQIIEGASDPTRLAQEYLEKSGPDEYSERTLRYAQGSFWRWNAQKYVQLSDEKLRADLWGFTKQSFDSSLERDERGRVLKVNRSVVSDTVEALKSIVYTDDAIPSWLCDGEQRKLIALQNGLLDLDALLAEKSESLLIPHTPEWFSSVCLPYSFDALAECPFWRQFLHKVLESDTDRVRLLQEWFGYCLTADTTQQKFLVLEGEGANGKSVVCEILGSLLGDENVSRVPLELFGQRFQLSNTLGKLANIVTEVGELDRVAEGILKGFVAGDPMMFEEKFKTGFSARPTARLLIATNNRPGFVDKTEGIWRRMLLMPFRVTIPEHEQDKGLTAKLQSELPGIFLWAIEGLKRLRKAKTFTQPTLCMAAVREYKLESNPARQFLQEHYESATDGAVTSATVFQTYKSWCEENGHSPLSGKLFGKEVYRAFPKVERKKVSSDGQREWAYSGIKPSAPTAP